MYAKIFAQIYDGTLCTRGPWQALVTFQQMLVLADQDGNVDMTATAISRRTTIPEDIIRCGIESLLLPDEESRTPAEDGRRIVPLSEGRSWGWRIVNYAHYRQLKRESDRRDYHREYWHNRKNSTQLNTTQHTQPNQPIAEAEAEADTKELKKKGPTALKKSPATPCGVDRPEDVCPEAWEDWTAHRRKAKASITTRVIDKLRESARQAGMTLEQAMDWTVQQNHQGFYPPKGGQHAPAQRPAPGSYAERRENQLIGAAILTGTYRPEKTVSPETMTLEHDDHAKIAR